MTGYKQIAHLLPDIIETADAAGEMRGDVLRALIDHALSNAGGNKLVLSTPATQATQDSKKDLKKRGPYTKSNGSIESTTKRGAKSKTEKNLKTKESQSKKKRSSSVTKPNEISRIIAPIVEIGELPLENVRGFIDTYQVNVEQLKKNYGYTEQGVVGKYSNLGSKKKSDAQIRSTVLLSVANGIAKGTFGVSIQELKNDFKTFGILDTNIKVNLERRVNLFSIFDLTQKIELSEEGKKYAAELLSELD